MDEWEKIVKANLKKPTMTSKWIEFMKGMAWSVS